MKKIKVICFALNWRIMQLCGFFLALSFSASAQELPKGLSEEEKEYEAEYWEQYRLDNSQRRTVDPLDNPRAPAEWEEMQGVAISWSWTFRNIHRQIVEGAQDVVTVYIHNDGDENEIRDYLAGNGIDPDDNIVFIDAPYNSLWIRDYGANVVYLNGVDSLVMVDWIYDRPRPLDDNIPLATAQELGVPVVSLTGAPTDLVHTGGNFMTDGQTRGFSSRLVVAENGEENQYGISNHSEEDVRGLLEDFMGVEEYLLMTELPFDVISHIDMHMKIVNEETIIVGEYPEGVADGPQIEANLMFLLDEIQSSYGRPFKIVRMPMPPDAQNRYPDANGDYRTYTNAIMLNSTVLLPVYEQQYDTTAERIWQETLPGHDIISIDCNNIIPLSGAIHCITKEIGAFDPIQIIHTPPMTLLAAEPYEITAEINHRHDIESVYLHYSQDGIVYDSVEMVPDQGLWSADLPGPLPGEVIYYISATSEIGKQIEKPLTGRRGGGYRVLVQGVTNAENPSLGSATVGHAFPNPASAMVMIPIELDERRSVTASLYDITGRLVHTFHDGDTDVYRQGLYFDASNVAPGTYMIAVSIDGQLVNNQKLEIVAN